MEFKNIKIAIFLSFKMMPQFSLISCYFSHHTHPNKTEYHPHSQYEFLILYLHFLCKGAEWDYGLFETPFCDHMWECWSLGTHGFPTLQNPCQMWEFNYSLSSQTQRTREVVDECLIFSLFWEKVCFVFVLVNSCRSVADQFIFQ